MYHFTDRDLLLLWDSAADHPLIEKGLLTLAFFYPDEAGELASLSIGDRDARLLQVREDLFGSHLYNTAICPKCGQKMEWEMPLEMLKLQPVKTTATPSIIETKVGERLFRLRLPNSADLMQMSRGGDSESYTRELLKKCMVYSDLPVEQIEFSDALTDAFSQLMNENDPQADIKLNLQCPWCGHEWATVFDIVQYLWLEIQEKAMHLLRDVYVLAGKFGWSEKDILSMSGRRRNLYLNMIEA